MALRDGRAAAACARLNLGARDSGAWSVPVLVAAVLIIAPGAWAQGFVGALDDGPVCTVRNQVSVPVAPCEEWADARPAPGSGGHQFNTPFIVEAAGGNVLFLGGTVDVPDHELHDDYNFIAVAYDTQDGGVLWSREYDGPPRRAERAQGVAASPSGDVVYLTGSSFDVLLDGHVSRTDFATVAYDARTGAQLWAGRFGFFEVADEPLQVIASPDGEFVYAGGHTHFAEATTDFMVVAHDAHDGAIRWIAGFNGPADAVDRMARMALSPDGSQLFVTGKTGPEIGPFDLLTIALDARSGVFQWSAVYNGPANGGEEVNDIVVAPDGSLVYVTGYSGGGVQGFDMITIAYDTATGAERWVGRFHDAQDAVYKDSIATGIAVAPDGQSVYVAGPSWFNNNNVALQKFTVLRYDAATGERKASATYSHGVTFWDYPFDIGVSRDGARVYVTGASKDVQVPGTGDWSDAAYASVAYRADTLEQVWSARRHGPVVPDVGTVDQWATGVAVLLSGFATQLAVGSAGDRLYTTGVVYTPQDAVKHYLTVAYEPFDGVI